MIATFVEGNLLVETKKGWMKDLALLAQQTLILWHREAERGFIYVKVDKVETTQHLILTTHVTH